MTNASNALAEARARAVAQAVCNAVTHPGTAWVVIRFVAHPWHFHPVAVDTLAQLGPHMVESPTYRAVINSDLSVSITNGAVVGA